MESPHLQLIIKSSMQYSSLKVHLTTPYFMQKPSVHMSETLAFMLNLISVQDQYFSKSSTSSNLCTSFCPNNGSLPRTNKLIILFSFDKYSKYITGKRTKLIFYPGYLATYVLNYITIYHNLIFLLYIIYHLKYTELLTVNKNINEKNRHQDIQYKKEK